MKKMNLWNYASKFLALSLAGAMLLITSCEEETPAPAEDAVASFTSAPGATFLDRDFTSSSLNAVSWDWNFGDAASADNTSTLENPSHTFSGEGTFTVSLVVANADGKASNTFTADVIISDPDKALKLLTGDVSKDWKLYREGVALEVGPSEASPAGWFGGENNGTRPCIYDDTWTFNFDGTMEYDDANSMWGEFGIWGTNSDENALFETCFEPTAANMTINGSDVSAWGSGSFGFEYAVADGDLILNGEGAWIVVPNLGTDANHAVDAFPSSKTVPITIEEFAGYDLLTVTFDHGDAGAGGQGFRRATYVSYDDWNDEPALVLDVPSCELEVFKPTALGHTFESETSFDNLGDISGGVSVITTGVTDPAGGATAVGQFDRTEAQFQEAMLRVDPAAKDLDLTGFTTISLDVYFPSSNDYTGTLTKVVALGLGDQSCVPQWWTALEQWVSDGTQAEDQWHTLTYDLGAVKDRTGLDMVFINIGSGDHTATGTFYIKNLKFE